MKIRITPVVVLAVMFPFTGLAQLNNGGLYANFGVDADSRSNYLKYGIVTGSVSSDDWFAPSGFGYNVIDTSNASGYFTQLQSGANISFSKRMSQLLYAKVNGRLWLDAAYGRDYIAAASAKDSTVFTSSAKNGDNPNAWPGGAGSTPAKNDLVDVFAHMRRDGSGIYDSLWFFTGASIYGNTGSAYFDAELYKKSFSYNAGTGVFTSAGTSGGHTEWLFDASGNITQTGDMIVAVSLGTGAVPTIDVRIWVSAGTYGTWFGGALTPKYFSFNSSFSTSSGSYGYASIVSPGGSTAFGGGIANYSGTPAQDTTYATPWGTNNSGSGFSSQFQSTQFIEVGLNLTRIGVDPALYSTLNPCQSMFSNIFFKSRSSGSFTSNLQDFVAPLTFLRPPVMDFSIKTDTLRCNHTTGTITLTDNSTATNFSWRALGSGNITGANGDSSALNINKPGSYVVSASPASGCPTMAVDTIVVPIDTFPPVASVNVGLARPHLDLLGGNPVASNYSTPFGGSQGLTWSWTGPGGFTSTIQNPITDTTWGLYSLTVMEKRNGCTASASKIISAGMFTVLLEDALDLRATPGGPAITLNWTDLDKSLDQRFTVERSNGTGDFQEIGEVVNTSTDPVPGAFAYLDSHPYSGYNYYRIKATSTNGLQYFSPVISVDRTDNDARKIFLSANQASSFSVTVQTASPGHAVLAEYNVAGQLLARRVSDLTGGYNVLNLPQPDDGQIHVAVLYIDGQPAWSQKIIR